MKLEQHLPEVQDGGQNSCTSIQLVCGCSPAQQGRQRPHHRTHPSVPVADLLQGGVHPRVQADGCCGCGCCWDASLRMQWIGCCSIYSVCHQVYVGGNGIR